MSNSQYILWNAKEIRQLFNSEKIGKPQLIISSPPYYDVKNYEDNSKQIGYGQHSYKEYLQDVAQVFQECYDLSYDNASFWLIIDTFKKDGEVHTLPFDINNELKESNKDTWILKEVIIWNKEKSLPWNGKGNFKNEFEYILFFTKGNNFKFNIDEVREINDLKKWWLSYPERYNPQGKAPSNVWEITTPLRGWGNGKQNHLCPFPFPLIEKILIIGTEPGDLVFDPFAGSGSALAIAVEMGRMAVGVDINKKYKDLFEKEVKQGAKLYWNNRQKEILKNTSAIKSFKETNLKLRKLKAGASIANHINNQNSHKFLHFLMEQKNELTMFTLENSVRPRIEINNNEKLQKLLLQTKITPVNKIVTEKELKDTLTKNTTLYNYDLSKFYSYHTKILFKTVMDGSDNRFNFIYSNIELKVH